MRYVHLGFGFLYEPIAKERFSPFASMKLQAAIPTDLQYIVDRPTTDQALVFDRAMINGGAKLAIGWEVSSGLRMQLAPRWMTSLGVYYTYMHFESDWPPIELRSFPHGLMRLNTFGLELGCQYLI
ncbi:MAG: hypothetical protein AAFY48_20335 [Bacteroidota bacterium]